MSPKDPLPIFLPSLYLFPTRNSMSTNYTSYQLPPKLTLLISYHKTPGVGRQFWATKYKFTKNEKSEKFKGQSSCFCISKMCWLVTWFIMSSLMLLIFKVASCVALILTNGAYPSIMASLHLEAQRHHLSPGFRPGKLPLLVDKSLPLLLVKLRKLWVIVAHTTCTPWSLLSVRQYPSL